MPHDFRNKSFQKILRGYAPDEVDEYIDYFNEEYKKLERRGADLERKLVLAHKKLEEYLTSKSLRDGENASAPAQTQTQAQVKEAAAKLLRDAEIKSAEITAAAQDKASALLDEAVRKAESVIAAAEAEADAHKNDAQQAYDAARGMYKEINAFREKLFDLYNTHLDAIEGMTDAAKGFMSDVNGKFGVSDELDEDELNEDESEDYEDIGDDFSDEPELEPDLDAHINEPEESTDETMTFIDSLFSESPDADEDAEIPAIGIDWKNLSAVGVDESDDFRPVDGFDDSDVEIADEPNVDFEDEGEADDEFRDIDSLFDDSKLKLDMSLTDEFNIIFADSKSKENVEEISRQPTVVPEIPKNSNKSKKN